MPLSRINRMSQESFVNIGPTVISAAYQMLPSDRLVRFTAGSVYTITLPPVAACTGDYYLLVKSSGASTITIVDKGDASTAISRAMASGTNVAMYVSDGVAWYLVTTTPA